LLALPLRCEDRLSLQKWRASVRAITESRFTLDPRVALGIGKSTLERWWRVFREENLLSGSQEDVEIELARLRKENEILRQERDLLKKQRSSLQMRGKRETNR